MRPKFPVAPNLSFLLRHHLRTGDEESLAMVEKTLTEIRRGGVYDHVGFGIHRYAIDREWLVPHFEKMLYDQALYVIACLEAYQVTGDEAHARNAREVLTYVTRDMTSTTGGFYSAEDADSEGEEGKFYTWKNAEILDVLGTGDGGLFLTTYRFQEDGNFPRGKPTRKTAPTFPICGLISRRMSVPGSSLSGRSSGSIARSASIRRRMTRSSPIGTGFKIRLTPAPRRSSGMRRMRRSRRRRPTLSSRPSRPKRDGF